jgi:hypothetical protein
MGMEQAQALVVGIAAYQKINPLPGAVRSGIFPGIRFF